MSDPCQRDKKVYTFLFSGKLADKEFEYYWYNGFFLGMDGVFGNLDFLGQILSESNGNGYQMVANMQLRFLEQTISTNPYILNKNLNGPWTMFVDLKEGPYREIMTQNYLFKAVVIKGNPYFQVNLLVMDLYKNKYSVEQFSSLSFNNV